MNIEFLDHDLLKILFHGCMTSRFANKLSLSCVNDVLFLPTSCLFFSFSLASPHDGQDTSVATLRTPSELSHTQDQVCPSAVLFPRAFLPHLLGPPVLPSQISWLDMRGGGFLMFCSTLFSRRLLCDPFLPNDVTEHWLCSQQ